MKMALEDIKTDVRFREDFGDLDELAESIKEYGLIHPPVVDENGMLIAGERRFKACKKLGLEEIEVRKLGELDELSRKELELEENLHRKAFTWEEEVRAKKQIHEIKRLKHGEKVKGHESDGWGVQDTAQTLDESLGTVSQDIQLAEAMEQYPELQKEKNKSSAWKKYKELQEKETLEKMAEVLDGQAKQDMFELYNEDFLDWAKNQEDESYDLVLADPPWGIEMDSKSALARNSNVEYDDDADASLLLLDKAADEWYRILKDNRHLYVYFGIKHYAEVKHILEFSGFEVCPIPVIYNKNRGGSAAKGKTFPVAYETIFHCWKGRRELKSTHHNVFTEKRPEGGIRVHSAQKPIAMQKNLIEASTDPGEKVLVPFMGSGSAVAAAVLNNREAVGIEKNESSFASAVEWINSRIEESEQ